MSVPGHKIRETAFGKSTKCKWAGSPERDSVTRIFYIYENSSFCMSADAFHNFLTAYL
jgi:hypothetical protein